MNKPKIVLFDIETMFNVGAFWRMFDEIKTLDAVFKEKYIVCACWKYLGEKKVHSVCVDPSEPDNDQHVVEKLYEVLEDADLIIAHNGDRFDIKEFNTRAIFYGMNPLPQAKTVDTLKVAKSKFKFLSNKLDYIAQYLGVGQKIKTSFSLWRECFEGDKKALKEMVTYCKMDVDVLEQVYLKLRPFVHNHPNIGLMKGEAAPTCPNCGGHHLQRRGERVTNVNRYARYQCQDCGKWSSERVAEDKLNKNKTLVSC
tara:strand:+ start:4543 stop:5307 length:765 start_codon:yes stop_codon:yes gene_type:complete